MGAAVIVGAGWVQTLARLPAAPACAIALAVALLILAWVAARHARHRATIASRAAAFAAAVACAAGYAGLRAHAALDARLTALHDGRDVDVVGVVVEMPQAAERGVRFRFRVERCADDVPDCPRRRTLAVSWPRVERKQRVLEPPQVLPAQRWRLTLRLRRPHASANPYLHDGELRALEEGTDGFATVRASGEPPGELVDERVLAAGALIERARTRLRDAIVHALRESSPQAAAVVAALVVGDQAAIASRDWERFNNTGIGHLMSISGVTDKYATNGRPQSL